MDVTSINLLRNHDVDKALPEIGRQRCYIALPESYGPLVGRESGSSKGAKTPPWKALVRIAGLRQLLLERLGFCPGEGATEGALAYSAR